MHGTKIKKLVGNMLLLGATVLVCMVVAEGVLRILDYDFPVESLHDPDTGYGIRPDLAGWVKTESIEYVRTDRFGLRTYDDPDRAREHARTLEKADGVFRVAVLGDSYTQGLHVAYEESFSYRMQEKLKSCANLSRGVEVLNFGVAGFSNVQELMAFRHRARRFEPDLVILVFDPKNDFRNNYRKLERYPFAPYAEFRGGELVLDLSFQSDPAFANRLLWSNLRNAIANYSHLLQWASITIGRMYQMRWHADRKQTWAEGRETVAKAAAPTDGVKTGGDGAARPNPVFPDESGRALDRYFMADYTPPGFDGSMEYLPPQSAFAEMLWKLAEAIVLQLRREVEQSGAAFLLTSNVTDLAISPDHEARRRFRENWLVEDLDYAQRRLGTFAQRQGFPFVPLLAPLRNLAERTGQNLSYFDKLQVENGHWNRSAQAVVAETLADAVCGLQAR